VRRPASHHTFTDASCAAHRRTASADERLTRSGGSTARGSVHSGTSVPGNVRILRGSQRVCRGGRACHGCTFRASIPRPGRVGTMELAAREMTHLYRKSSKRKGRPSPSPWLPRTCLCSRATGDHRRCAVTFCDRAGQSFSAPPGYRAGACRLQRDIQAIWDDDQNGVLKRHGP
jgi:hypothetical protein